jgi:hypothetical protein
MPDLHNHSLRIQLQILYLHEHPTFCVGYILAQGYYIVVYCTYPRFECLSTKWPYIHTKLVLYHWII